jgi:adenosylmethionine-8-amino-7-oxononanoate aminotransferase
LIAQHALGLGILLRPIGNHVYLIPPYCVTEDEIARIIDVARLSVEWAVSQPSAQHTVNASGTLSLP